MQIFVICSLKRRNVFRCLFQCFSRSLYVQYQPSNVFSKTWIMETCQMPGTSSHFPSMQVFSNNNLEVFHLSIFAIFFSRRLSIAAIQRSIENPHHRKFKKVVGVSFVRYVIAELFGSLVVGMFFSKLFFKQTLGWIATIRHLLFLVIGGIGFSTVVKLFLWSFSKTKTVEVVIS